MINNKNHWYDGWFYDVVIAPNQDRLFREIDKLIKPNSKVIDVGCGTGRFSFSIADKISEIIGIDLSQKNIIKANQNLSKKKNSKISFLHTDLESLISQNKHFDYAVMTFVIHEVDKSERVKLLKQMTQISDKVIIGDYIVPVSTGFWSFLNEIVEFLAGKEHYSNFKNFVEEEGLKGLLNKTGLKVIEEIKNKPVTSQLMVISK